MNNLLPIIKGSLPHEGKIKLTTSESWRRLYARVNEVSDRKAKELVEMLNSIFSEKTDLISFRFDERTPEELIKARVL